MKAIRRASNTGLSMSFKTIIKSSYTRIYKIF